MFQVIQVMPVKCSSYRYFTNLVFLIKSNEHSELLWLKMGIHALSVYVNWYALFCAML